MMFAVLTSKNRGAFLVNTMDNPEYFKRGGIDGVLPGPNETLCGMFSKRSDAERHLATLTPAQKGG